MNFLLDKNPLEELYKLAPSQCGVDQPRSKSRS